MEIDICPHFGVAPADVPVSRGANRETSELYRNEIFRIGRYRVAVCNDNMQWLYQRRRKGNAAATARWDTLGYCVTRAALMRLHRSKTGMLTLEFNSLPERFIPGGGRNERFALPLGPAGSGPHRFQIHAAGSCPPAR